ncbi:hypothetical protein GCM10010430_04200 [Kitasatospora cystarginea]|uniref:Peptidase S9 prolyl oligopeptidase catalytic domain-containing protein n=1 Tax=Kitasatospora cystarginea TaxID=58350 RepID=A0ABP5QB07_9ACTN
MSAPATGTQTTRPTLRTSIRFSADGRFAAGLAGCDGRMWVELWSFDGSSAQWRALPSDAGETLRTQPVPTLDGRVLVLRPGPGGHRLTLLQHTGGAVEERLLGTVATRGARLLASPDPGLLGWLVTAGDSMSVWRIEAGGDPTVAEALRSSERFGGGTWLDRAGRLLSVSRRVGGRAVPAVLDLATGDLVPDPALPGSTAGEVVLASTDSGLRVLVSRAGAELTLAGPDLTVRRIPGLGGEVRPLAFAPGGRRVALHAAVGARSEVVVYDVDTDRVSRLHLPEGVVRGQAGWTAAGLRFPFSAPTLPTGMALVEENGGWAFNGSERVGVEAHTEWLDGAGGPVEAVVHGGAGWWRRPRVVIALHGGPQAHWDLGHQPFLQRLAATGAGVLAPNQRGSTGYGRAHRDVLNGCWGVPDLADVLRIADEVARRRAALGLAPPALFGTSYGAYLALLAAGLRPQLWSGCLAVAPFLSGPHLHREALPPTRALLERLDALREPPDEIGARDLARVFAARPPSGLPLFLVHGRRDEVIPVGQSRELREVLLRAGWTEGRDLFCHEVPLGGHSPLDDGTAEAALVDAAAGFLTGTP